MTFRARPPDRRPPATLLGSGAPSVTADAPPGDDPSDVGDPSGSRDRNEPGGVDAIASRLFRDRYATLVQMARLLVDDLDTAEEVVQEAFVRLYGSWRRLRDPARAEDYLRSTVWNLARDRLRRRRHVRHYQAVSARGPDAGRMGIPVPAGPADAVVAEERRQQLVTALDRLPTRQRECMLLRYWGDLSEREIASTLGISTGSVKSHVHRALNRLTADLGEDEDDRADRRDRAERDEAP
jgi:RNA polymerase sigma-70 factor (sigma-E family)